MTTLRLAPPPGYHTIGQAATALRLTRQRVHALLRTRGIRPRKARDAGGRVVYLISDADLDILRQRNPPGRPWPRRAESPRKQRGK